jgi:hypothetical protein
VTVSTTSGFLFKTGGQIGKVGEEIVEPGAEFDTKDRGRMKGE